MNPQSASASSESRKFLAGPLCPENQTVDPTRKGRTPRSAVLCIAIVVVGLGGLVSARAQSPPLNPDLVAAKWPASWIASPLAPAKAPGVFYFRKEIVLATVPQHYWVHVSADIRPDAPGFRRVLIAPHLRGLHHLNASMPHAGGAIHTVYQPEGASWKATVTLPAGLSGQLVWGTHEYPLHAATQVLRLAGEER